MTTSKIELPKLPDDRLKEIEKMDAAGWSLRAIALKTDVPYTTVYFFAVNDGRPTPPPMPECAAPCWCGEKHYGHGLCRKHWRQMYEKRRAA